MQHYRHDRPTIGVLAGWQYFRTATNLSYLAPVFRGISRAAQDLGCNLLLGCGIGPSASPSDPLRPAWPVPSPDVDFVPIGPWNTDGILIANPLHSQARSAYIQELIALGDPVLFIGSGETGPTIVADNLGGIREAMRHLVDHGHTQIAFIAGTREDMSGDWPLDREKFPANVQYWCTRSFAADLVADQTSGIAFYAIKHMGRDELPVSHVYKWRLVTRGLDLSDAVAPNGRGR